MMIHEKTRKVRGSSVILKVTIRERKRLVLHGTLEYSAKIAKRGYLFMTDIKALESHLRFRSRIRYGPVLCGCRRILHRSRSSMLRHCLQTSLSIVVTPQCLVFAIHGLCMQVNILLLKNLIKNSQFLRTVFPSTCILPVFALIQVVSSA